MYLSSTELRKALRLCSEQVQIYELMEDVMSFLQKLLDDFVAERIPNHQVSDEELIKLVKVILENQNSNSKVYKKGGWSLIPTNEGAPSDIRVRYMFFPSYIIVSLLTAFKDRYPVQAAKIDSYDSTLHLGMKFTTYRNLMGHGIEGEEERTKAVSILVKGGVHKYAIANRDSVAECETLFLVLAEYKQSLVRPPHLSNLEIYLLDQLSSYPSDLTPTTYLKNKVLLNRT